MADILQASAMPLIAVESPHTVAVTMDRLVRALERRRITVFARVDHGGGARAAGLELADEELLIFGDPRAGTLLMQADAEVGYELPLRVLAWDDGGRTHVGYSPPLGLAERYAVSDRQDLLDRMTGLLDELLAESTAAA